MNQLSTTAIGCGGRVWGGSEGRGVGEGVWEGLRGECGVDVGAGVEEDPRRRLGECGPWEQCRVSKEVQHNRSANTVHQQTQYTSKHSIFADIRILQITIFMRFCANSEKDKTFMEAQHAEHTQASSKRGQWSGHYCGIPEMRADLHNMLSPQANAFHRSTRQYGCTEHEQPCITLDIFDKYGRTEHE